jgi:hypothetical protein
MLNCEKCNYIKTATGKESKIIKTCGLTGFVFRKEFEAYEMGNHPCYNYSFMEDQLDADVMAS